MSINNREDLNKYYQLVNNLVDEYTEKWKIRPSNLKRYLQPGSERFNKFLERNKLNDDIGKIVLRDVIEDRFHMEKDGVVTFESFQLFESAEFKIQSMKECLYKGIEKATIKYEKTLADYFDSNLGDIDIIDSEKHQFKIKDWNNEDIKVLIYSEEDLEIIKENISEHLLDELQKKNIELTKNLFLKLEDLIDKDSYYEKMKKELSDNFCIKLIEDLTGHSYKGNPDGYYVWID